MQSTWLSGLAIALTLLGFVPYIRGIRQGQVRPHVFSWVIWGSSTSLVFLAQLSGGGGLGAWPIGVSGLVTLYIAGLAYVRRADCQITRLDTVFFVTALCALPVWYFTANPLWAVVILTSIDIAGFWPTWRKTWAAPHGENLLFYWVFALRNALALSALDNVNLTTALFPAATGLACVGLASMALWRRRTLPATPVTRAIP